MSFCSAKYDVFISYFCGVKYVLKMLKYGKISDSEIQISRGYISEKTNVFKPFIIQVLLLKGGSVWHGDPDV